LTALSLHAADQSSPYIALPAPGKKFGAHLTAGRSMAIKNGPTGSAGSTAKDQSYILHPNIHRPLLPRVISGDGYYVTVEDGRRILEACAGLAVACLGHGRREITDAVVKQMNQLSYCFAVNYCNSPAEQLAQTIISTTNHRLAKATIMSSGEKVEQTTLRRSILTDHWRAYRVGGRRGSDEAGCQVLL
jgi:hypothetical protein